MQKGCLSMIGKNHGRQPFLRFGENDPLTGICKSRAAKRLTIVSRTTILNMVHIEVME